MTSAAYKIGHFIAFLHTFWLAVSVNFAGRIGLHNVEYWPTLHGVSADDPWSIAHYCLLCLVFLHFSVCAKTDNMKAYRAKQFTI